MEIKHLFLIVIILGYIIYTIRAQIKIIKNRILTRKQKIPNSILIWLVPFLWFFLINDLISPKGSVMTKKNRDELIKKQNGGFYESGIGISE